MTPQVVEKIETLTEQMEGWKSRVALRRQTLQSLVDGLRYFSTVPHPLDLFFGKP